MTGSRHVKHPADRAPSPSFLPWIVWGIGALFFCFGFFLRLAPSVMEADLMRDLAIGAAVLGNLSAFYFYAYAGLQIPLGALLDRWPEKVLPAGMAVCAAGCLLFGIAHDVTLAYAGRFLIGAGAASAWIGTVKLISMWFPSNRFARVNGLTAMLGMVGGIGAQAPLALVVEVAGWRGTMTAGAGFAAALAVVAWLVLGRNTGAARQETPGTGGTQFLRHLGGVVRTPQTWAAALVVAMGSFPVLVFVGLWGVPYLMAAHGLERPLAAASTSIYLVGFGIGAPLLGWLSDRIGRRRSPMLIGTVAAFIALLALIYVPGLPLAAVQALLFVSGFAGSSCLVSYAVARENNRPDAAGAMAGTVNMTAMTLSALGQPFVGWILDLEWDGRMAAGAPVYSPEAYHTAFLCLALSGAVAVAAALATRETHCRPVTAY